MSTENSVVTETKGFNRREYKRQYLQKHREKINARRRAAYALNPDRQRAINRIRSLQYYRENAERIKQYWKSNPEKRLARNEKARLRRQSQDYKARHNAWAKKHWADNRDHMITKGKRSYLRNRDKRLAAMRARYQKNKAKRNAASKQWRKDNRGKDRAYGAIQKARRRNIPAQDKNKIIRWMAHWHELHRVICYWCGKKFSPEHCQADHIIPLAKGGKHCIENLVIACKSCNNQKHAALPTEWNKRLEQPRLLL